MRKSTTTVVMKSNTWTRDSHGLYDYESRSVVKKSLKATTSSYMVRRGDNIDLQPERTIDPNEGDTKIIGHLEYDDGNFLLYHGDPNGEKLFLIVKSLKSNNGIKGYKLMEDDIIKLGRVKFRVKEIRGDNDPLEKLSEVQNKDGSTTIFDEQRQKKKYVLQNIVDKEYLASTASLTCRICLMEGGELDNPLISPCKCAGTMQHIHLQCLQEWLKNKINMKENGSSISCVWKNLDCELCKDPYPSQVGFNGKFVDLIKIPKPPSSYIILEALCRDRNTTRGLHIIDMQNKTNIRLGRGHDSDIRISDISVSRCHAMIRHINGSFYLEDNSSKFGTLVQIKKPIALSSQMTLSVQVGRSVVVFSLKKPWSFLPTCFRPNNGTAEHLPNSLNYVQAPVKPGNGRSSSVMGKNNWSTSLDRGEKLGDGRINTFTDDPQLKGTMAGGFHNEEMKEEEEKNSLAKGDGVRPRSDTADMFKPLARREQLIAADHPLDDDHDAEFDSNEGESNNRNGDFERDSEGSEIGIDGSMSADSGDQNNLANGEDDDEDEAERTLVMNDDQAGSENDVEMASDNSPNGNQNGNRNENQ
eukprot:CAMPEP_0115045900 /NCGR_PEP_ID=MMETSP0216-20121206/48445_1 /TAXON_ID=223996 /ORGANISM="Protocruzia adherens, Strain Boccale" /LENGTH=584 /DNA_ID=CAMNT_0002428911 /DNA_START=43 /DNA_END=1797 /DNA_ORIENTATION=+